MLEYSLPDVATDMFALPFTMPLLGSMLLHDYETHRHLLGVGVLAMRLAATAGLSREAALALGQAALFHDVGKLHIDPMLLSAARPLDEREWYVMREHSEIGERMLRARGAAKLARIVRGHHERIDGSGYPDGLRGSAIPWQTRLLAVADAYDSLRAGRPYALPLENHAALERLDAARHLFDPEAVEALVVTLSSREATTAIS
ncbi:MAG: metal dependent phosphohydrolase [Candidatus Eremiobacteraeota bacterium]|nr:metal dependent phosphohydrolase [Candidatus Eremiobacteraeota bacterium]